VPRTPVDGFDLNAYAAVAAHLAEGAVPRAAILAGRQLDEARWLQIEKTWLLRLATAALQGDLSLAEEHEAAYTAALGAADPPMPLDDYAAIVAGLELGLEPAKVLAGAKLTLAGFSRHQRAWTARFARDDELAASFRRKVEERRAATCR
jgi:hypothetical protein